MMENESEVFYYGMAICQIAIGQGYQSADFEYEGKNYRVELNSTGMPSVREIKLNIWERVKRKCTRSNVVFERT